MAAVALKNVQIRVVFQVPVLPKEEPSAEFGDASSVKVSAKLYRATKTENVPV